MLTRPLLALLLLWSCGTPPPAVEPGLTLGAGEGAYRDFEDGETLGLITGCQGSQHVWVAMRAQGIDRRGTLIDVSIRRASDDVVVSQTFRVRISMQPVPGSETLYELYGLTVQVPEPDEAIGEDLILSVTDQDDVEVTDERPIRIEWGEGGCDDRPGPTDPSLTLGAGVDGFETFEDGATLDLSPDCVGTHRLRLGLLATDIDPADALVGLELRRASDEVVVSEEFSVRVSLEEIPGGDGASSVGGLDLIVPDPDLALDQDLVVSATVTDAGDVTVSDERPIRVAIGPDLCGD